MKKLITTLAALAVTISFSTAADDPAKEKAEGKKGANPEQRFKKLDANSDGKVTLEEMKASPGKGDASKIDGSFKRLDKNSDGSVSQEEFTAGAMKKGAKPETAVKAAGGAGKPEAGTPATSVPAEKK